MIIVYYIECSSGVFYASSDYDEVFARRASITECAERHVIRFTQVVVHHGSGQVGR